MVDDAHSADVPEPPRRVHRSSRDRLRFGCLGAAGASALYLTYIGLAHPTIALAAAIYVAIFISLAGILYVFAERASSDAGWTSSAGAALLLAMGGGVLHGFLLLEAPSLTVFMALVVLAAGVLHSATRWLLTVLALCVAGWLVAGFSMLGASFALPAIALILVAVISFLAHLVLMRYVAAMDRMHARDRQHHEDLARALAAAQHELVERRRAEAERELLREQLLHSQKLEAIGTLAGGVAHDMNNVLAAILGVAEGIRAEALASDTEGIDQIIEAARRGADLTRNLLGFSRRGKYRKERVELSSVVASVAGLLSRTLPKSVELDTSVSAAGEVEGDSAQLNQALVNLCLNAADAMNGTGALRIRVEEVALSGSRARSHGLADGNYVTLSVADTGCGMDQETQSRMFEPFFTTKEQGRGTGLGLSMVYGTIGNHGGAVAVDSAVGRGTTFTLYLPAAGPRAPVAPQAGTSTGEPIASGMVLVVDDEPMVQRATRRQLERAGCQVVTACNGSEAVALFRQRRAEIRAVVLDMSMPIMGGAECFAALREIDPEVRVILASGYALEKEARSCLDAGAVAFLEKPYEVEELLALLRPR